MDDRPASCTANGDPQAARRKPHLITFPGERVALPPTLSARATGAPAPSTAPTSPERHRPVHTAHCARAPCKTRTTMAPAATGAGVGSLRAAAPVAKAYRYSKAAARSVWLGLPALLPVPGLRLTAAQGQTRAASFFCKAVERNVEAMAAGEPAAAPVAENEELTEFVNALKQEWDRVEDKYAVTTLAVAATLGMWAAGGVVSAIDRLPLIPGLMEAVGIGYSGWFAYRNLLFKPDRDAFFAKVREIYEDIISA